MTTTNDFPVSFGRSQIGTPRSFRMRLPSIAFCLWIPLALWLVGATAARAQAPVITSAPLSQIAVVGQPVSMSVTASGSGLTYQWRRNGQVVSGETTSSLNLASATVADGGYYEVLVSNGAGAAMAVFHLRVAVASSTVVAWGNNSSGQATVPAGLDDANLVSAGGFHTLALRPDGTVMGWGLNTSGQVTIPPGLNNIVAVAAGANHSLALRADGTVVAWGSNSAGQSTVTVGLGSLNNVVAIAAGGMHSVALKADGTVVVWGDGSFGQKNVPANLAGVVAVASGGNHVLALKSDGTVVAWGSFLSGSMTVPPGLSNVVAVAGGQSHSLALRRDGTVVAWGDNAQGQSTVPPGLTDVVAISAAENCSIALRGNGTVAAWGNNSWGQSNIPANLSGVGAVSVGARHTLALVPAYVSSVELASETRVIPVGGSVTFSAVAIGSGPFSYQWYRGGTPLVDGTAVSGATTPTLTVTDVQYADGGVYHIEIRAGDDIAISGETIVQVPPAITSRPRSKIAVAGGTVSFSVAASGGEPLTYQWKRNGQPIAGATGPELTLEAVTLADRGTYSVVVRNSTGGEAISVVVLNVSSVANAGAIAAWGLNNSGQTTPPFTGKHYTAIDVGTSHTLALASDGTVTGWGGSIAGLTTAPAGLADVVAIAANNDVNVVLKADGSLVIWGRPTSIYAPWTVPMDLNRVIAISLGTLRVALRDDGSVYTWADGNATATPIPAGNAVAIAGGNGHGLALRADGTIFAWGANESGQCDVPAGLGNVTAIAAGGNHSLALRPDGTVVAWGANFLGQADVPAGLTDVVAISAAWEISMALTADGRVVVWGGGNPSEIVPPTGLPAASAISAGRYHVAALVVPAAPVIATQPLGMTVPAGGNLTLSVTVNGTPPFGYQWKRNGVPLPAKDPVLGLADPTTAILTLTNLQESESGSYTVDITNAAGGVSSAAAVVTVSDGSSVAPIIKGQTSSVAVLAGTPVSFAVNAAGAQPLAYQWYRGSAGNTSAPIEGAESNSLTVPPAGTSESYWVRISNPGGTTDSATMRVMPWVARDAGSGSSNLGGAAYANGRYFIMRSEYGAVSADGVSWDQFHAGGFTVSRANPIAYGNGTYVVGGGSTTGNIYISSDGVSWSSRLSAQDGIVSRIIFNGNVFVAVGDHGQISTSVDGLTWTLRDYSSNLGFKDVAVGGSLHVAVGGSGLIAIASDDMSWTEVPAPTHHPFLAVTYGEGRFVALAGPAFDAQRYQVWTSEDGSSWTQVSLPRMPSGIELPTGSGNGIAFGGGMFVMAVGKNLLLSEDGVTWSVTPDFFPTQTIYPNSLAYGNGRFLAAGQSGALLQSLPISGAVEISTITASHFVNSGESTLLEVSSSGPGLSHQWYRGTSGNTSQPIAGANGASFSTPALTESQAYWVRVSNDLGAVDGATIEVSVATPPVVVTSSQRSWEIPAGKPVTLSVQVSGAPAADLQWYRGRRGDTSAPLANAAEDTLTFTASDKIEYYWLHASNMAGTADSDEFRVVPWIQWGNDMDISNIRNVDGTLIAVGGYDVRTSADGRVWTLRATINNSYLRDIARGAGLYVAVGERGFYSSPDLVTWTQRNVPSGPDYNGALSLAYGNGVFVAVGYGCVVSADGVNWSNVSLPAGVRLLSVVHDGGQFVAGGSVAGANPWPTDIGAVFTSPDGVFWTRQLNTGVTDTASDDRTAIDRIDFVGGRYIATSSTGNIVLTSPDSSNWSRRDLDTHLGGSCRSIAHAKGRYMIGTDSHGYFLSTDAVDWEANAGPVGMSTRTLVEIGGEILASGSTGLMFRSRDGFEWTPEAGASHPAIFSLAYGAGRYVGLAHNATYSATDGQGWQRMETDVSGQSSGRVIFALGQFVVNLENQGQVATSRDGRNWRRCVVEGATSAFGNVVGAGTRVFALGIAGGLAVTNDLESWVFVADAASGMSFSDIAFGSELYVAVGNGIATSTDGTVWAKQELNVGSNLRAVAHGSGTFVAVGRKDGSESILTSPDGQTWTERVALAPNIALYDIEFTGAEFLIGSYNGVLSSLDGVEWECRTEFGDVTSLTLANGRMITDTGLRRVADGASVSISSAVRPEPVVPGQTATLGVSAMGPSLTYQWFAGSSGDTSAPLVGAIADSYTTPPLTTTGRYWVRVSDSINVVESETILAPVIGPPSIVLHPRSAEFTGDVQSTMLRVEADGYPGPTYQWYKGRSGDTLHPVEEATRSSLYVTASEATERYWVRVTNAHGSVDSNEAVLSPWDRLLITGADGAPFGAAGLALGQGRLVVSGNKMPFEAVVQVSENGQDWNPTPAPRLGTLCFGNNRFVAASLVASARVYWSENGTSWSEVTFSETAAQVTEVFFIGGRFVAIGMNGTIAISNDGVSWVLQSLGSERIHAVATDGSRWVGVGEAGRIFHSVDGLTWNTVSSPTVSTINGVAFGAGKFLAVTDDGQALVSSDGASWTMVASEMVDGWLMAPAGRSLTCVNGRFFAASASPTGPTYISDDGILWRPGPPVSHHRFLNGTHVGIQQTFFRSETEPTTGFSGTSGGALFRTRPEAAVPYITTYPIAQDAFTGGSVTFSVEAVSATPVSYQWRRNGIDLPGATKPSLTLTDLQFADAGVFVVVVSNAAGSVGSKETLLSVSPAIAPVITSQPQSQAAGLGQTVVLRVAATGSPPLAYQWQKAGAPITAATQSSYTIPSVQAGDAGEYSVVVSNSAGSVPSTTATLAVVSAETTAGHAMLESGYTPGGTITVESTLTYPGPLTAIEWQVLLPSGWTFAAGSGPAGDIGPSAGAAELLEWRWSSIPPSPFRFSYTLNVPADQSGMAEIVALAGLHGADGVLQMVAKPDPLLLLPSRHSADTNQDFRLSLTELLRVIELYNTRNGTVRTGAYAVDEANEEDGFGTAPARPNTEVATLTRYHSADINRDGRLSLTELLRVIELYNFRSGTVRTGQYRVHAGTEDGFIPGP